MVSDTGFVAVVLGHQASRRGSCLANSLNGAPWPGGMPVLLQQWEQRFVLILEMIPGITRRPVLPHAVLPFGTHHSVSSHSPSAIRCSRFQEPSTSHRDRQLPSNGVG